MALCSSPPTLATTPWYVNALLGLWKVRIEPKYCYRCGYKRVVALTLKSCASWQTKHAPARSSTTRLRSLVGISLLRRSYREIFCETSVDTRVQPQPEPLLLKEKPTEPQHRHFLASLLEIVQQDHLKSIANIVVYRNVHLSQSKRKTAAAPADVDFGDDQLSELRAAYDFYGATGDSLKKDDLRSIMGKLSTSQLLQESLLRARKRRFSLSCLYFERRPPTKKWVESCNRS